MEKQSGKENKNNDLCSTCKNYFSDSQLIHNFGIVYVPFCVIKGDLRNVEYPLKTCNDYIKNK